MTFETTDGLALGGWSVAASGPLPRVTVLVFNSRRLYEAAVAPKTLLVLPDADHNDDDLLAGDDMIRAIVRFLQPLT